MISYHDFYELELAARVIAIKSAIDSFLKDERYTEFASSVEAKFMFFPDAELSEYTEQHYTNVVYLKLLRDQESVLQLLVEQGAETETGIIEPAAMISRTFRP